ncbi:MAG: BspA family leucine-rich repeat surface protein [Oscillospiraceae bacterium]|nr:BspA family leucine-rich repeat surface protein [Oscillospiraceae bacterium]
MNMKRILALLLAMLLCLSISGCGREGENTPPTAPTRENKPILPGFGDTQPSPNDYTAVYVTVFEDLAIIAAYPILEYEEMEPDCGPRELSDGGSILCGGDHEDEYPITHVIITGQLVPKSMAGWFRDMVHLEQIEGLEKLRTHHVTDMNHLFAGCEQLTEVDIDAWDVSNVADMTGIFDGCTALSQLPDWYVEDANENLG